MFTILTTSWNILKNVYLILWKWKGSELNKLRGKKVYMVKCKTYDCFTSKQQFLKLCQHSTFQKYEECFQRKNACSTFSRMTDLINFSENELKVKEWDGFHNWLYCICVVTFDLELGQALEVEIGFTNLHLSMLNLNFSEYIPPACITY